jgi:hypothetical protein
VLQKRTALQKFVQDIEDHSEYSEEPKVIKRPKRTIEESPVKQEEKESSGGNTPRSSGSEENYVPAGMKLNNPTTEN